KPTVTGRTPLPLTPPEREQAIAQEEAQRQQAEATLKRKAAPFWFLVALGFILFISGFILFISGQGWTAPLGIAGLVIGSIGFAGTFIFSQMSSPVKVGCLGIPLGVVLLTFGLELGVGGLTTLGIIIGVLGL